MCVKYPLDGLIKRVVGYPAVMAPRSIWNGTVSFGLVKVPVKLFSAIEPKGISFREIHTKDDSLLQHRRVCKAEGKPVDREEVERGHEVSPGEYVTLDAEEFKAAAGERPKSIEIEEFVAAEEIDPFYFNKAYYLGMREVPEPYALLNACLRDSAKIGIGRFTFHNREYLVAIRADRDHMMLHTLRFADEIVGSEDLDLPSGGKAPSAKEVKMARRLVEGLTEDFEPGDFEDEYRSAVMDLIERKASGRKARRKRQVKRRKAESLESALEKSLAAQGVD